MKKNTENVNKNVSHADNTNKLVIKEKEKERKVEIFNKEEIIPGVTSNPYLSSEMAEAPAFERGSRTMV